MSQPIFSFEERVGLFFVIEAATLSICAVTAILLYAIYKRVRTWPRSSEIEASDSVLFLNLMLADLIQGIGHGMRNCLFPVAIGLLVVSVVLSARDAGFFLG